MSGIFIGYTGAISTTTAVQVAADILASVLTTSLSAYNSAGVNSIVKITLAEYNAIAALSGATKAGVTDETMMAAKQVFSNNFIVKNTSYANTSTGTMFVSGYPVAIKCQFYGAYTTATTTAIQAGYSTTSSQLSTATGFTLTTRTASIGLSTSTISALYNFIYGVFKTPTKSVPAGAYPVVLVAGGAPYLAAATSGPSSNAASFSTTGYTDAAGATTQSSGVNAIAAYQFIQLPTKQW